MAKKKGGKKKRQDSVQSTQTVQPEQAALQNDFAAAEAHKEPVLTDAVSEVLGDQKQGKKEKKINKKFKAQIAKFAADGHGVSELEAMLDTASADEMKGAMKAFEEGVSAFGNIRAVLKEMNIAGFEKQVEELNSLMSNPMRHQDASAKFESLKIARRVNEISSALNKMVLPTMKLKVEAMKAILQNSRDLDDIEAEFSNLKREYKEAYAEEGVKAQIAADQPEPPKADAKARASMVVKDIFLLYKDGKFISHHTNRVVSKDQQRELFADLKVGRDFLRSPKYLPQKLNIIPAQNRNILVQSGRFTVVIVVAEGSVHRLSESITAKVITLMEKEDLMQLKDWNGDVSSLKSSGKYMQALLFAFMKLSKGQ